MIYIPDRACPLNYPDMKCLYTTFSFIQGLIEEINPRRGF